MLINVKVVLYDNEGMTVLYENDEEYIVMNDEYQVFSLQKVNNYEVFEHDIVDLPEYNRRLVLRQFNYWDKFKHQYIKNKPV